MEIRRFVDKNIMSFISNVEERTALSQSRIALKQTCLPPFITFNTRKKIEPEKVDVNDIVLQQKKTLKENATLIDNPELKPVPIHPLSLMWSPDQMHFDINKDVIKRNLRIWNSGLRSIYVQCCGLWDDTARLGASWYCYPYTRFLIPPGLKVELTIKATPRLHSPIPLAYIGLQLAAAHLRDNVTGYFVVTIVVKFSNYAQPYAGEGAC